jgi:hypothetical protein
MKTINFIMDQQLAESLNRNGLVIPNHIINGQLYENVPLKISKQIALWEPMVGNKRTLHL